MFIVGKLTMPKRRVWQLPENAHKKPPGSKPSDPPKSTTNKPTGSNKTTGKKTGGKTAPPNSKTLNTKADPEEPSSDLDSPAEQSNRLTGQDSKARRLAKFDPRQMSMGDTPQSPVAPLSI